MMNIQDFTTKLCQLLEVDEESLQIDINEDENRLEINLTIPEEEAAFFIGSRGDTLVAIEYLLKTIFKDEYPDKRIVLDINEYKGRKLDALRDKTIRIAERVVRSEGSSRHVFGHGSDSRAVRACPVAVPGAGRRHQ